RDVGNALPLDIGIAANLGDDLALLRIALGEGRADLAGRHESLDRAAHVVFAGLAAEAARGRERDGGIRPRRQTFDRGRQTRAAIDLDGDALVAFAQFVDRPAD